MKTFTQKKNKEIILAAIEDCKTQKANGKSRYDIEKALQEIGIPFELSLFIASVAFN
jgi:hypothetical protein